MSMKSKHISYWQWVLIISVSALVAACGSTASVQPRAIHPGDFEDSVVLVGTLASPNDGYRDTILIWNADNQKQRWIIGNEQMVPLARKDVELSLFAIHLPPGRYIYSSYMSEYRSFLPMNSAEAVSSYRGNELLTPEPMKAGDFIYMGRAICQTHLTGCNWWLKDESIMDLELLRAANPLLPWSRIKNRFDLAAGIDEGE